MKSLVPVFFLFCMLALQPLALASKKNCTNEPKEKWMKIEDFKKKIEAQGYQIRKFKQPGTCYEIYGKDSQGKSIEIYFNPVTGEEHKKYGMP
ncbi:MAG: PepSY domain-containing protein [Bdellovibrio sp.]